MSQQDNKPMQQHFYRASAADFGKIPGSPVAYWMSDRFINCFNFPKVGAVAECEGKNVTANNDLFLRNHWEVDSTNIGRDLKWLFYSKGGPFRKWAGNLDFVINWSNEARDFYRRNHSSRLIDEFYWYRPGITWTDITSSGTGFRYLPIDTTYDTTGISFFLSKDQGIIELLSALNSKPCLSMLTIINPTLHANLIDVKALPIPNLDAVTTELGSRCIELADQDWVSFETSWGFNQSPLINYSLGQNLCEITYVHINRSWRENTLEMQRLEEENNRLFIEAYGLQDELTPEVPLSEITLTCNPHYRYGGNLTDEEREARLQSDTIAELISYAIGCMMGRYSLNREGLVYAHAGNEGFKALVEEGAYSTFAADDDGILPLTSENWFEDDVAARIEEFVATVWGKEQLEENLKFIADSLCLYAVKPVKKGGETARETIRRYLSSQFYKDHLKTYKKRPIYWLFSSGKEKAFECLVYLHRYNESTLPRMRTEYVTPLLGQMASRIERKRMEQTEATTTEAKRLAKEIDSLTKQLNELRAFDDQLKHHADMRITLDLDDGVKVNYGKFGTLLSDVKAITGDKGE